MRLRAVGLRTVASAVALGLICALTAEGGIPGGSDSASALARFAPCGYGYPKPPPRRYRFHHWGSTDYYGFGKETYDYTGILKRVVCRGTHVEYWQTKGRGKLTFVNIDAGAPSECNFMGPPYQASFNGQGSFPLKRFGTDFGVDWIGNEYNFSSQLDRAEKHVVSGIVSCANGVNFAAKLGHRWTGDIFQKGRPKRIVKGFFKYRDFEDFFYRIHWRLKAIK
jgi:hypothetical protein